MLPNDCDADDPRREAMRIAPRALLCASAFRAGGAVDDDGSQKCAD